MKSIKPILFDRHRKANPFLFPRVQACLILFLLASFSLAQEMPVMPYDSLMDDRVSVDGEVDREDNEYPAEFEDPGTGITISWGFDDSLIYLALETEAKGWFGIGFGAPKMNESNMVIGFYTDDSTAVYNVVGKDYGYTVAAEADSLFPDWDIDFDDETGVTTLEFTYPLKWSGEDAPEIFAQNEVLKGTAIPGLEPGDIFDLILAQNTKTISLKTKPTQHGQLKFKMAGIPAAVPEQGKK